jgi:hypothetical protein
MFVTSQSLFMAICNIMLPMLIVNVTGLWQRGHGASHFLCRVDVREACREGYNGFQTCELLRLPCFLNLRFAAGTHISIVGRST